MRTQEEYLAGLAKMRPNVYFHGKKIGRDDPQVTHAARAVCTTFSLAESAEYGELLTATSHLTGKKINRFTHIHQNMEDLMKKQEMTRKLCAHVGGCIQRCMGIDMLNAVSVVTKDCDLKHGTNYHENYLKFAKYFQENDLVAAGSQTDPKGDRMARPSQQWDPDQYLHVVERRPDGVVVRGAKIHNTIAPYADELIVTPTRLMGPDEGDWAISFAIPADAEGIYLICRQAAVAQRPENLDAPITNVSDIECMTIFDDVFVPNDRIFLNGETDFAGPMALTFALYHRHSYTGCKPGIGDIMIGTTGMMADINNIRKQSHVKEKLVDLISVAELVYAAGIAAAYKSTKSAAGTQLPDVTYANVGRRHAGHNIYHEYNILCDIAGGLPATLPEPADYNNPEIGDYIRKYITRKEGVSAEDCYKAYLFCSDILTGELFQVLLVAGVHGGGSPIMEDIAIMANYNLKEKIAYAKHLAGIDS